MSWTPIADVPELEPVPGPTVPLVMNLTNLPTRHDVLGSSLPYAMLPHTFSDPLLL